MIMIGALTMANVVILLQVPGNLAELIVNAQLSNFALIVILIVFYLFPKLSLWLPSLLMNY